MAVDTRNKRSSAINPACPWRGLWPTPDGTIGDADRQHADYLYAGISAVVTAASGIRFCPATGQRIDATVAESLRVGFCGDTGQRVGADTDALQRLEAEREAGQRIRFVPGARPVN